MTGFLLQCMSMLASRAPRTLVLTVIAAIVLAGVCWWVCTNYYRLWNKRFHVGPVHMALCGLAAAMTLLFTVVFVSLAYTRQITENSVNTWQKRAANDRTLMVAAFRRGYAAVKASGLEDFSKVLPPEDPRAILPTTTDRSRQIASKAYVDETLDDFRRTNPWVSRVLRLPPVTIAMVMADRARFARERPRTSYPMMRAVDVAAQHLRASLLPQAPGTVTKVRLMAVAAFLLFQAVPFAAIGWSAYRDLKEQT